jgi:hypothetical protein
LPATTTAADVPPELRRLLGWPAKGPLAPGAYPSGR